MKKWAYLAAFVGAAISFSAAPASAATYLLSFDGQIVSGADAAHLFGSDLDLSGKSFTLSYSFDFPSPDVTVESFNNPILSSRTAVATVSTVTLTIDGQAVSLQSDDVRYSRAVRMAEHSLDAVANNLAGNGLISNLSSASVDMSAATTAFFTSTNPFAALDYTINRGRDGDDVIGGGHFSLVAAGSSGGRTLTSQGDLSLDRVRLSELAAAVPEPASWAMMLVGFGAVGRSLRLRRRRPAGAVQAL